MNPPTSKRQKNTLIYLYILLIFLSTLTFYNILQIESEKQVKTKYKIIEKTHHPRKDVNKNLLEDLFILNLPSGKEVKLFDH